MNRESCLGILLMAILCQVGCSLCATPFDLDYVTYGSRTPRADMRHGRVGSNLSDPAITGGYSDKTEMGLPADIQPLESDYGTVLESTSGTIDKDSMDGEFEIAEEPMLLEQRSPSQYRPQGKSKIIQVPSGDSFFDEGN